MKLKTYKIHPHTVFLALLLCWQQISTACSKRLPLEIYELTAASAQAAAKGDAEADGDGHGSSSAADAPTHTYTKHKNVAEYVTIDGRVAAQEHKAAAMAATSTTTPKADDGDHRADTNRHARQMTEQKQQHLKDNNNYNRQRHVVVGGGGSGVGDALQHVRILYQVGETEDHLPICAPNAVCSKIDLYDVPWIERQCRCPEVNRQPHIIIHHHNQQHHHASQQHHSSENNNVATHSHTHSPTSTTLPAAAPSSLPSTHDKFRSHYELERLLSHKRLLAGNEFDQKYEHYHLKKLMQRLGAVYEDDLHIQASDYASSADNEALPHPEELVGDLEQEEYDDEMSELRYNEFPHNASPSSSSHNRNFYTVAGSTAHMRHSGHHAGHRVKDTITFIGGCPSNLGAEDGHTIVDKTRHYKMCQPVHKLPVCEYFKDFTWTLTTSADLNGTAQIVHCRCPRNSVTYLTKREPATDGAGGYTYLFACSPMTRIRCQRKQPCKLFTVRKRQELVDEVNINVLCQCPKGHKCPSHHSQSSVIQGETFTEENIQTYSGYCMGND